MNFHAGGVAGSSDANVKDEIGEESRSSGPAQRKPTDDSRKPTTLPSDGKEFVECSLCDKNVPAASWRRHRRFHQGGRPHSCHVCGLGFADRGNLARHTAERHHRLRPHACALCNRTFARKAHLRDHAASHSAARDHVCDVCGRASKSAAALRMHKKMHDDTLGFHCAFCDARFRRRSQLVAHASVHTGERAHACACGRAFRLRSQLNAHARTHDAEMSGDRRVDVAGPIDRPDPAEPAAPPPGPPRTCVYCRAECPEPQLKEHLISTHSELLFRCDECDSYVDRQDFVEHMSQHAVEYAADAADAAGEEARPAPGVDNEDGEAPGEERDGGASVNGDEFSDRSDAEYFGELPDSVFEAIEDSQDTQPADDGDRLSRADAATPAGPAAPLAIPAVDGRKTKKERACPVCSKVYTASSSYFYHVKHAHGAGRQHECDVCGRRFGAKPTLAQHLLIHAAERPYACAQCGNTFRARAALYVHEQTHGGRRTHACGQCGRSFRWRAHLERHRRRHAGGREHACDACGRTFNVRADLLRHARTHAAAALPCPHCELRFAQPRYLRAHLNNKHAAELVGVVK